MLRVSQSFRFWQAKMPSKLRQNFCKVNHAWCDAAEGGGGGRGGSGGGGVYNR